LARKLAEENTRHAVLAAYTGALKGSEDSRRSAFNAALRAYRMSHPGISEGVVRRRVAQIICFADWYRPG
jgi:hypothetical protein